MDTKIKDIYDLYSKKFVVKRDDPLVSGKKQCFMCNEKLGKDDSFLMCFFELTADISSGKNLNDPLLRQGFKPILALINPASFPNRFIMGIALLFCSDQCVSLFCLNAGCYMPPDENDDVIQWL